MNRLRDGCLHEPVLAWPAPKTGTRGAPFQPILRGTLADPLLLSEDQNSLLWELGGSTCVQPRTTTPRGWKSLAELLLHFERAFSRKVLS